MTGVAPARHGARGRFRVIAALLLVGTITAVPAIAVEDRLTGIEAVPSAPIADGFTLAATGDIIYLRPMLSTIERQSPGMLKLLRSADATFGNFETTVLDLQHFEGAPQAESGGTWMLADPGVVADVRAMGFNIVSFANNHVTDWGVEGLRETTRRLDDAGIVHAGAGRNLSAARAPRYLDLPAGRVALIAATSSFTPMSRAADGLGEVPGRPGVNALRTEQINLVGEGDLRILARIAGTKTGQPVILNETRYAARNDGETAGSKYIINAADEAGNILSVRQAKQNGNLVLFSLHNHEPDNDSEVPPDFAIKIAHDVIDSGADMFLGHGPHRLRGIEIYKGNPIFYSLGNFAMMNNSLDVLPPDIYEEYGVAAGTTTTAEFLQARNGREFSDRDLYESVIAINRYVHGRVSEIRLYPIDLGVSKQGAARGVPTLAGAALGRRTLERLQRLSQPFGTHISIEKGVGIIRVTANRDIRK
jgi:poly-gamma-glutamate capsule biosynthesis protein CapA/YwtB (metallophosphatase superfamily)